MAFWDDLKQLGKDIGGEISNLGKELNEIGKDTIKEIKQDPAKYLVDSAKEVATGAVKIGKYVLEEGIPDAGFLSVKKMGDLYRSGQLPEDRHEAYFEQVRNGLSLSRRQIDHLLNKEAPSADNDIKNRINLLKKAINRLDWFLNSSGLDLDSDAFKDAQSEIDRAKEAILALEEQGN